MHSTRVEAVLLWQTFYFKTNTALKIKFSAAVNFWGIGVDRFPVLEQKLKLGWTVST